MKEKIIIVIIGIIIGSAATQYDVAMQIDKGYVDCWFRDKVEIKGKNCV